MGNNLNQPNRAEQIAQIGGISYQEFVNLQMEFKKASGKESKLYFSEFMRLYSNLTGISPDRIDNKAMAERMFLAIDLDNNQYISFDEFIMAYILLVNPDEHISKKIEKFLACYFGGYIPDYIDPSDAFKIQQSISILCGIPTNCQQGYQTNYMGYMPQMGQPQMMGQGMNMPCNGMNMPGNGMNIASYGMNSPGYGMNSPGYGMNSPGYGMNSPGYGMNSPGYGVTTAGYGMNTAGHGMYSGGMGSQMHQYPHMGLRQQTYGILRDQLIQSITGHLRHASFLGH